MANQVLADGDAVTVVLTATAGAQDPSLFGEGERGVLVAQGRREPRRQPSRTIDGGEVMAHAEHLGGVP